MNKHQAWEFSLLALCIWREGRGEPYTGKVAIGCSIRNRVNKPSWWGTGYDGIILKPYQYSSFNTNDANSVKFPTPGLVWDECMKAADEVYNNNLADVTSGATHYYLKTTPEPAWVKGAEFKVEIGSHRFYIAA